MGIDLGDVVIKHPTTLQDLHGQTVAFDAWNVLYQFLSNIRQPDGTPLMDAQGRVTSHLAGCLYRTANLVEAGIKPVFVFDGQPHHLKRETLAARSERRKQAEADYQDAKAAGDDEKAFSKAQQTSKMTSDMADEAKHLLRSLGIPVIEAPSEGEAQAAWAGPGADRHADGPLTGRHARPLARPERRSDASRWHEAHAALRSFWSRLSRPSPPPRRRGGPPAAPDLS